MLFDKMRFKNPEAADRIHPFWFWNGEMEQEQIELQIQEMANKGIGGFFICARQGLKIPYLSEAWFEKVRVAVEAAKECGLDVWLYDEYPYPSGIAGGEVILEHPEAKHYSLSHTSHKAIGGERVTLELPWARILFAKAVPVNSDGRKLWDQAIPIRSYIGNFQADSIFQKTGLTSYNQKRFFTYRTIQKLDWIVPEGQWEILIVQEREIEDFKYYGTFVDPCNQEAMATFIRLTHDKYAHYLGEYFGTTIKGMFTDEIGLLGSVPWSPKLAAFFQERNDYDLLEHLHALFDAESENAVKVRYDYYQSVHLLLLEAYHKQVHDWCERYGLRYVTEVPSVRHTTQRYSHIPAGDSAHEKLGRSLDWILNDKAGDIRSNAKMISSIARQLNRERNLVECFHSVGWSMTLQDARWMIDRMAALGTNFFNFHAFFYTVDGLAQHDAPPSQFLQNPYWQHFRQLGDYTSRLSYVMSTGEAVISTAIVQPTTSLWTKMGNPFHGFTYSGDQAEEKSQLQSLIQWWFRICNLMHRDGRDFDHLDPELLAEAVVSQGMIKLGVASYSVIILPPLTNLEQGAWRKLEQFLGQGGTVISMGQLPYETIESGMSDTRESKLPIGQTHTIAAEGGSSNTIAVEFGHSQVNFWDSTEEAEQPQWIKGSHHAYHLSFQVEQAAEQVLEPLSQLLRELEPLAVRLEPACADWGLLLQTRLISEDSALVFISNQEGERREVELNIEPHLWGKPMDTHTAYSILFRELSLEVGEELELQGSMKGSSGKLNIQLAPYEARLIEVTRMLHTDQASKAGVGEGTSGLLWNWEIEASEPWEMTALQPNALRLDTFTMTIGKPNNPDSLDYEGTSVQVKTFIDQCADVAGMSSLPVTMQQMFGTPMKLSMAYPLHVRYTKTFIVDKLPEQAALLMDQSAISGKPVIKINNHILDMKQFTPVFLYDHRNVAQQIAPYLNEGTNQLSIDVEVLQDGDGVLDALYVTGPFGVRMDAKDCPVITAAASQAQPLQAGPYVNYPYYAGVFSFRRAIVLREFPVAAEFELIFGGWDPQLHDCVEVIVNGHSLGVRPWSPYRWKGNTSYLSKGNNTIEVRITNTLIGLLEGKYFDDAEHAVKPVQDKKW